MSRISWDDYFINITNTVSERSTCLRRKIGAIAVKHNRILATGAVIGNPGSFPVMPLSGRIDSRLLDFLF